MRMVHPRVSPETAGSDAGIPVQMRPAATPGCCWTGLLEHRSRLLVLARWYGCSPEDAHDVVQDALLRAATHPPADPQRLGAFLDRIVRRLTVDRFRDQQRQQRLSQHVALQPRPDPSPEEQVCDRAEGAWLQVQSARLSARERDVLLARAAGSSPAAVAADLHTTVKAIESITGRARLHLRAVLATTWTLAALLAAGPMVTAVHPAPPPPQAHRPAAASARRVSS